MFDIGTGELMVILVLALLMFGGRLPDVARNLGRSVAELKRGFSETTRPLREARVEVERGMAEAGDPGDRGTATPPPPPSPPPSPPPAGGP